MVTARSKELEIRDETLYRSDFDKLIFGILPAVTWEERVNANPRILDPVRE
jgi:hypothetical protein